MVWGERFSQYNPDCHGICSVDQNGTELKRPACLCHLSAGVKGIYYLAQLNPQTLKEIFHNPYLYKDMDRGH